MRRLGQQILFYICIFLGGEERKRKGLREFVAKFAQSKIPFKIGHLNGKYNYSD